jgi:hypothetical protein
MATQNSTKNSDAKLATVRDPILDKINELMTQFDEETRAKYLLHKARLLSLPARKQRTKRVVKELAKVRRIIRILSTAIQVEQGMRSSRA